MFPGLLRLSPEEVRRRRIAALRGGRGDGIVGRPTCFAPSWAATTTALVVDRLPDRAATKKAELNAALAMRTHPDAVGGKDKEKVETLTAMAALLEGRTSLTSSLIISPQIQTFHSINRNNTVIVMLDNKEWWLPQSVTTSSLLSKYDDSFRRLRPAGVKMDSVLVV